MFGVLRLESLRKGYDRHQPEFLQTEPSGVIFQVRAQCLENKFLLWIEVKDKVGSKESWRRWALGRLKGVQPCRRVTESILAVASDVGNASSA